MQNNTSPPTKIHHIVIAGGGVSGLAAYGVLRKLHDAGRWNIQDIRSIYGTSIGAMLAVALALKYDFQTIDDYIVQRPWHQLFKYDIYSIFGAFERRGIFNISIIEEIFSPLFKGADTSSPISINTTLAEFYEITGIDIHMYSTEINAFVSVDISHKTHPDWRVVEAVYASCCLPLFFSPLVKDGKYYVDGGIFLNYPLEPCISNLDQQCGGGSILGIRKKYKESENDKIGENSNLMDYIMVLLNKTLMIVTKDVDINIDIDIDISTVVQEVVIDAAVISAVDLFKMVSSQEFREQQIQEGCEMAVAYLGLDRDPIEPNPQIEIECPS